MHIAIRDWQIHFERDRTAKWKSLQWVPIPNKQGLGYKKIMSQENGLEIFACWIALVQEASKQKVRGDLSKYSISDLSSLTFIKEEKLEIAIKYLSENLDWIINLDVSVNNIDVSVKNLDKCAHIPPVDSSILFSSIQSNSNTSLKDKDSIQDTEIIKDAQVHIISTEELLSKPILDKCEEVNYFREHYHGTGKFSPVVAGMIRNLPPEERKQVKDGTLAYETYNKTLYPEKFPYAPFLPSAEKFIENKQYLEDWIAKIPGKQKEVDKENGVYRDKDGRVWNL